MRALSQENIWLNYSKRKWMNQRGTKKCKSNFGIVMINRLEFSIDIQTDKTIIWKALWDDNIYRDWAGVFFEGSYYVANNINEGSKMVVLVPDESGIFSLIHTHVPKKTYQFKRIGKVIKKRKCRLTMKRKKGPAPQKNAHNDWSTTLDLAS